MKPNQPKSANRCKTTGKKTYTKTGALSALMHASEVHNAYHPTGYYKCEDCGDYHLTSIPLLTRMRLKEKIGYTA